MDNQEKNQLRPRYYVNLSSIILLLFVLMLFIMNLAYFTQKTDKECEDGSICLHKEVSDHDFMIRESDQDYYFTLLATEDSLVEDGLKKAKMPYHLTASLREVDKEKGHLIIDSCLLKEEDYRWIKDFIQEGKKVIFLNMPTIEEIEKYELKDLLGIRESHGKQAENELNIVPGFMLGGFHELRDLRYNLYDIDLLFSAKVYGFGGSSRPVIWRNTYRGSEIYVVNGPFMQTNAAYGILTALMGEAYEDYIYPIINTRLMTYEGFPYISHENKARLEEIYSRDAMKVQNDILVPEILTMNTRREFIPNGYLRLGFDPGQDLVLREADIGQVTSVKNQISKEGGQVGMWYSGDLAHELAMFEAVFPEDEIQSIFLGKEPDELDELLEVSDALQSIVGPWKGAKSFHYLDDQVVYIPITVDGLVSTGQQRLDFISGVTAFGALVQNLSLEDVILLKGNQENWQEMSRRATLFIDEYRERFDFLESRNMTRAANAVKAFRNNLLQIKHGNDQIHIDFDHLHDEAYFILKTDKKIGQITNGEIREIEQGVYLITVTQKNMTLEIRDDPRKTYRR